MAWDSLQDVKVIMWKLVYSCLHLPAVTTAVTVESSYFSACAHQPCSKEIEINHTHFIFPLCCEVNDHIHSVEDRRPVITQRKAPSQPSMTAGLFPATHRAQPPSERELFAQVQSDGPVGTPERKNTPSDHVVLTCMHCMCGRMHCMCGRLHCTCGHIV